MPFYDVQDVYQKKQLQTRLDKRPDIISGKANVAAAIKAGESGGTLSPSAGVLGTLRKFLGSKKHLDWLKIDLHVAAIITVLDYIMHKKLM